MTPQSYFLILSLILRRHSFHINITIPTATATNAALDLQKEGENCSLPWCHCQEW